MEHFDISKHEIFTTLFNSVSEGIIVVNQNQTIVATNFSANEMFGYDENELHGTDLDALVPMNYRHNHGAHVSSFMKKSEKRTMGHGRDLFGLKKDGKLFPVEAGLNPFIINDHRYVIALVIDITERKEQEKEIQALNNQLEAKIVKRTEQLNQSINDLKAEVIRRKDAEQKMKESLRKERELNELKTKFLSLVSHEFKTPLSGIMTSAQLISKYTQGEQQERREKHIKTIQGKVKYLNNILNDFLSIERLETGKENYNIVAVSVGRVIQEVINDASLLLKEGQKITLNAQFDDVIIRFDQKILHVVLSNVIHNAIKYSQENSEVLIEGTENESNLSIVIKDQGIGIPIQEQKHIFNRYFRAENAVLTQGTGIGLNIVKGHLENLGGEITFTSELNKGSTFTITLPK
ncbi:MAG: PAS domain-containing sensor histidine kinase [Gilvibacter sp.]